MKKWLLALLCTLSLAQSAAASDKLIQLVEYIGADYSAAVAQGEIISADEFAEMSEFSELIVTEAKRYRNDNLNQQALHLAEQVVAKVDSAQIRKTTARLRQKIFALMPQVELPASPPALNHGRQLYRENCTQCHGAQGFGDGELAKNLTPAPTDFHDSERYQSRSLFGLFNTISHGVDATGMQSYGHLPLQDRWDLAFYVGSLATQPVDNTFSDELLQPHQIKRLITSTPQDLQNSMGQLGNRWMMYFRQHPDAVFSAKAASPWEIAQDYLNSVTRHLDDRTTAHTLAVSAYLEGFELVEQQLDTVDKPLRLEIEKQMISLRSQLKGDTSDAEIRTQVDSLNTLIDQAKGVLSSTQLSPAAVFTLSLLIILREGLEALLVVAAIMAVAKKTGQKGLRRAVHGGWIGALALGAVTWFIANSMIDISGASREVTEGSTALIAAGILFYMGFWMHSKTNANQWQKFIEEKVGKALSGSTRWALVSLVFLAVYREVFETILFYQSLWIQGGSVAALHFGSGLASGVAILAIAGFALLKLSTRLPLKWFFGGTAVFMLVLAIVMAGKGMAALHEAGIFHSGALALPEVDLLGIYPIWQSLLLQALL
ncbi:FTR1 family protein, partial [Oceanospirillum sp. HFRX-1_2]